MTVIVEKRFAVKHAVLPGRDHGAGLQLGRIEDRFNGSFDDGRAELREQF